uniref:Uncharacterized protein n=1 Tax=Rhizobium leguminosarum bv. viciae TaxID=387 RepID=A0A0U3JQV2_RHILV|nr:hypothetical protein [Rhizobium leguminosarum bv. viciae]
MRKGYSSKSKRDSGRRDIDVSALMSPLSPLFPLAAGDVS